MLVMDFHRSVAFGWNLDFLIGVIVSPLPWCQRRAVIFECGIPLGCFYCFLAEQVD